MLVLTGKVLLTRDHVLNSEGDLECLASLELLAVFLYERQYRSRKPGIDVTYRTGEESRDHLAFRGDLNMVSMVAWILDSHDSHHQ